MTASHSPILAYDSSDEYRPEPAPEPQAPVWRDGSVRIGIHTSIANSFAGSLESASKLGCNALQIFSASPRMWPRVGARIPEMAAAEFRAKRAELGLGPVVIHANYLINLATSDPVMRVRSIQAFHDEIVRGMALGADYLVVHPGSYRGRTLHKRFATWRTLFVRPRAECAFAAHSAICAIAGCACCSRILPAWAPRSARTLKN
jgi:endonuclease IV